MPLKRKAAAQSSTSTTSTEKSDKFWDLASNRRVTVSSFSGSPRIDLREYYTDKESGELKPGKKGISLSIEQWRTLLGLKDEIEEAIVGGGGGGIEQTENDGEDKENDEKKKKNLKKSRNRTTEEIDDEDD